MSGAKPRRRFGPYLCAEQLGRGAHGVVYRAWHEARPDEKVALKVIESRGSLDRLRLEPGILAQLEHPGIVRLFDHFIDQDRVVLALEYIDGIDLQNYAQQKQRLSPAEVREFLKQMGRALHYAHQHQVLHRDIKPSNILVEQKDGQARFVLVDFGVSRIAGGIQLQRRVGGTAHFMAPEQLRGRAVKQSDLWGLGVVAYFLLTGELPFAGDNLSELTRNVLYKEPASPSRSSSTPDPELDAIIFHLLEKQIERRTDSARELLRELRTDASLEADKSASRTRRSRGMSLEDQAAQELGKSHLLSNLFLTVCILHRLAELVMPQIFAGTSLVLLITAPFVTHAYLKGRRVQRELLLLRSFREESKTPETTIVTLQSYLETHYCDLVVHQRYVEALLEVGDARQAAVEARMMLNIDPYNIAGSLLLAQSYFELGLYTSAVRVCDNYLAVSGYCFEFTDLKDRCVRLGSGA